MVEAGLICTLVDMDSISVAGSVVLTSTVEENGRRFACNGEMVTFTCQVFRSVFLTWNSPLIHQTLIVFVSGITAPVSTSRPPFIATLTSIAGIGLNTNFTSTLQVNASRTFAKNQTTVECRNLRHVTEESKFTVTGTWIARMFSYFSRLNTCHPNWSPTLTFEGCLLVRAKVLFHLSLL